MAIGNSVTRWGWLAQGLHWLMALALIGNFIVGFIGEDMRLSPDKIKLLLWHKSVGVTLLALVLVRLLWRAAQPTPQLPSMPAWQRALAQLSHALLYVLMLALPISGWLMNSAADFPLKWFGWFELPSLVGPNDALKQQFALWHEYLGWALVAVLALHIAAAIKHAMIDKDDVLKRMLPRA